ncbi:MAG: V-type ATPase subunit [Nitrososphaerota archaeon]
MLREGRVADVIYSTVKSFASKGTIIPRSGLETLAESRDLEDLATRLKGTVYSEAVARASRPYSAEKFERAFREYLAKMHYSLIQVSPNPELLISYYLRHIVWNLKAVLKGRALNMSFEEVLRHVNLYAEELMGRRDLIVKAVSAKSLDEASNLLKKSEFGEDVNSAVNLYKSKGDIQIFDTFIDRAFYRSVLSSYDRLKKRRVRRGPSEAPKVRAMVAIDVDSYNVLSILRAKLWGLTISETRNLLVEPSFNLTSKTLERMIATESIDEAAKYLTATPYRRALPVGASGEELIARLESGFELMGYEEALKTFTWQVYGLGVVLGILKLRELEVRNLSAIAFGVEQGIGFHQIMSKLTVLA